MYLPSRSKHPLPHKQTTRCLPRVTGRLYVSLSPPPTVPPPPPPPLAHTYSSKSGRQRRRRRWSGTPRTWPSSTAAIRWRLHHRPPPPPAASTTGRSEPAPDAGRASGPGRGASRVATGVSGGARRGGTWRRRVCLGAPRGDVAWRVCPMARVSRVVALTHARGACVACRGADTRSWRVSPV
jgi:hypothetical protein